MTLTPTDEQAAIVDAIIDHQHLAVQALAGTGKTSTLLLAAQAKEHLLKMGTFVVFGKSNKVEAEKVFPATVKCRTSHGLAYGEVGSRYRHRLSTTRGTDGGRRTGKQLADLFATDGFEVSKERAITPVGVAIWAKRAITRFCYSADKELTAWHIPRLDDADKAAQDAFAAHVLPYAKQMWSDIQNPRSNRAEFTHDCYLKIWAMSRPRIPGDFIMLDEAQDANPLLLDVLTKQNSQLIAVGDSNQQLFCQPIGTLVTVPKMGTPAPEEKRCMAPGCIRKYDYGKAKLCWTHYQQRESGKPFSLCKPGRNGGREVEIDQVAIEDLAPGDLVCTFDDKSHVYKTGRPITSVTRLAYDGQMFTVSTPSGLSSSYTAQHQCVVRVGEELRDKHIVYMMRRGNQFRIGRAKFFYATANNMFGLALRANSEKAEAAWVLSLHDSVADAALAEALVQHQFNIPGVRFEPTNERDAIDVRRFWEKFGPNPEAAVRCLEHHGRLMEFPLWSSGRQQLIGVRRPFVTAAANLIDGMRVLPFGNAIKYKNQRSAVAPKDRWEPITVTSTWYTGDIVSLEVADHHTYFADGILTHNSWRNAVDALLKWPAEVRLSLTESFRFGPEIAQAANRWLQALDCDLRLVGRGKPGRVGTVDRPDAILCRTNAGAVEQAMNGLGGGRAVGMAKSVMDDIRSMSYAALALQAGKTPEHPSLATFSSWFQVLDYVDNDPTAGDLAVFVRLVEKYGASELLDVVDRTVDIEKAKSKSTLAIITGHKSKGMQWPGVRIGPDFRTPTLDEHGQLKPMPADELQLCYVAATRPQTELDDTTLAWIDDYLKGQPTPEAFKRWQQRQRTTDLKGI